MARQLLWLETEWPEKVAAARWYLGGPQYWAYRLSGGGASELTYLAAQTHFWNFDDAGSPASCGTGSGSGSSRR